MVLDDLIQLIKSRKNGDANKSYTARLFNQGLEECCKKFGEESVELIIAALNKKDDNLKQEAADLIYHLFVLLELCNVDFEDIQIKIRAVGCMKVLSFPRGASASLGSSSLFFKTKDTKSPERHVYWITPNID